MLDLADSCRDGNKPLDFTTAYVSWVVGRMLGSLERLCSTKWTSELVRPELPEEKYETMSCSILYVFPKY
jgi:hypothetical protein